MSTQTLFHRAQGDGRSFWGPGDLYTFLVTGDESDGAYFSMLAIVPPGGGPPPHTHRDEDETFYVLEGTPTFRLGDERIVAGPGSFVNVPKGILHCFRNFSDEPVRMILTFTPAGIERFFEETLERALRPHPGVPGQPRGGRRALRGGGAALRHGVLPGRRAGVAASGRVVRSCGGRPLAPIPRGQEAPCPQ